MEFKRETELIQDILNKKEEQNQFSGVVYIKHQDQVLYSSAYGYANRTWGIKNDLNTKFRIGSISKMFTAVAVLKLAQEKKISLQDKIHTYLDLKNSNIPNDVTVYHLLTHTSGIGDYFDEKNSTDEDWFALWKKRPIYEVKELGDYYEMFREEQPLFNAGEKFHYSGAGYILLGILIEKITQKKHNDYIKEVILDKVKLENTKYIDNEVVEISVADGYEPDCDEEGKVTAWRKNIFTMTPMPASDGGATSTADDLVKFSRALRNNELLNPEYTKVILEPKVLDQYSDGSEGYTWKYGFANWFLLDEDKIVRYGHTGEEFGVSARLYYYTEKDIDVILLGNQGFCTGSVGWDIHDLIVGKM